MNQFGSFTKQASAFPTKKSPTFQGYARFMKSATPVSSPSRVVLPPTVHAAKDNNNDGLIPFDQLDDNNKLTILSDIEHDQHLNDFKDALKRDFDLAS